MNDNVQELKPQKTWSHLAVNRRRPSEYEIVSTNLLWNHTPDYRPELAKDMAIDQWNQKYRYGSPLQVEDWEAFRDPDEIVYRTYNIMQDGAETYVKGLLDRYSDLDHDKQFSDGWVKIQAKLYTTARYVVHALQMMSAYCAGYAQSSTISNVHQWQTADEMRLMSRIAYRTAELAKSFPDEGFGERELELWEADPVWQGFRELVETGLVAYDVGESAVMLNLIIKPAIDECVLRELSKIARQEGDELFSLIADSHLRDSDRSKRWFSAFVSFCEEKEGNHDVIKSWIDKWLPKADAAIDAFCQALPDSDSAARSVKSRTHGYLSEQGYL